MNKALFPRDTVQSRLPDPEWLEHWLDKQIHFDAVWENKVVERILHNMACCSTAVSRACRNSIATARKLPRRLAAEAAPQDA